MRILHAAETIKGGVATVMRALALAQTEAHSVTCLVPEDQAREVSPLKPATFTRTGRNLGSFLAFTFAFLKQVWKINPDVVHLHSTFAGVLGRSSILLLWPLRRPRVIYTPHAWAFLMEGSPAKKRAYATIERLLYPVTHAIICVSGYEAKEAARFNIPATKLHVVHNGTPLVNEKPEGSPYHTANNLLFVGRLDYQKGFDILLAAMKLLEDTPLHLTVVGESVHANTKPPVRPNITYKGWLTSAQLQPYFAHATAVVVPSRWEGFAMVPLEAMSHGIPVIASNTSSLPEVVQQGKTGLLFTAGDPTELAELLRTTRGADWQKMGAAAKAAHAESFTTSAMQSKTQTLYKA